MRLQAKWFGGSECDLKSDISWYYTYYDKNFIDKTININSLYLNDNEFFLRFSNCKNWITNDEYYYNTDVLERYFVFDFNWNQIKLVLMIQSTTFIIIPITVWVIKY